MPRTLFGALLCAVVSACESPSGRPEAVQALSPAAASLEALAERSDERAEEVVQCLEDGNFERARELLDRLLCEDWMARARRELALGAPEDALTAVDRALELEPGNPEVRLLKADASLRLGEARIESGGSAGLIEGVLTDALEAYRGAGESAHALFGASRAAWLLGKTELALEHARRGMTLLASGASVPLELGQTPERIYAEQVFAAYAAARSAGSETAAALANEAEDALGRMLGRASDDVWTWTQLAELYEREGSLAAAQETLVRALKRNPVDAGLLERLARVSTARDGAAASVQAFEAYTAEHPEVALGRWQLAVARLRLALEGYRAEPRELDPAPFTRCETEFRALREELSEFADAALVHEAVCRLARGWCAFQTSDLVAARREFLSMNELLERGIECAWPGELENGIQGLFYVADAYQTRGELEAAGEVFETLRALQPESAQWANNAGFTLREAADALEKEGKNLCRAARGTLTSAEALAELRALAGLPREANGDERAAFARAANERLAHARALMERSWKAYRPAAELAPTDVRVMNDAALVLVHYLHRDLDWAEQQLLRCVELGGPQVEAKREALRAEADPERAAALETELALLTEAWGDAHENLGALEWVHKRKNAAAARTWLEAAVQIGPERRSVTNSLLPQVRGELPPEEDDYWDLLSWAQPCEVH